MDYLLIRFALLFLMMHVFIAPADGLACYACAVTKPDDPTCESGNSKLISSKLEMGKFVKNCSENESYCMIEKITTRYSLVSYIRDCSNGYSFSYSQIDRLRGIAPNNSSRCAFYNEHIVCVTLCLGNFCNGPQEVSLSMRVEYSRIIVLMMSMFVTLYTWFSYRG